MNWQPLDTAPFDTEVFVVTLYDDGDYSLYVGYKSADSKGRVFWSGQESMGLDPTYWLPHPEIPKP